MYNRTPYKKIILTSRPISFNGRRYMRRGRRRRRDDGGHGVYTAVRRCREPRARAPNKASHAPRVAQPPPIRQKSEPRAILPNVRDIRSFSETKWKKNLGEGRAEPRTVYPLLYAPTTERRRAQRGLSSKNIFRS